MVCIIAEGDTTNIWNYVKTAAENSGDDKGIWQELKKLPPEELLQCGEQFAIAVVNKTENADEWAALITINAILSYHKDKLSYDDTAREVGEIIANSEVPLWVYGSMAWLEHNKHDMAISPKGYNFLADGILKTLCNPMRTEEIQMIVLKKVSAYKITSHFSDEQRAKIIVQCQTIAAGTASDKVKDMAASTVNCVLQWLQEEEKKKTLN